MDNRNNPSKQENKKKFKISFITKENENGNANVPEDQKKKKIRFLTCLLLSLFCLSFFFLSSFYEKEEKVEYTTFLEQVEEGKVEEIKVNTESGNIKYELDKKRYYTNYPYTDTFIETMLLKGVDVEYEKNVFLKNVMTTVITYLPFLFLFFFMRRMLGGGVVGEGEKFYDVKSEGEKEKNKTSFSDIAGMEEIKEDMRSLAELIKNKEYKEKGVEIPKGVLLDGPPGNGKTLLARAFANECGLEFLSLNASDFVTSPFMGVASQKINKLFKDAKEKAPCVIFIDEIDAIGSKRMAARSGAEKDFNSSLTTLLTNMDGFKTSDDIVVIAATNRAEELDAALVRPGRFDRKFTIGLPDKKTRHELFALYTKNMKLAEDVNLESLVNQTYGCSSAKVKSIVNEALISSIKNKRDAVSGEDFSNAIIRMTLNGVEKKKERWEGKTKDVVAYHEAGHAVVAHLLGRSISSISIIPTTASAGGYTMQSVDDEGIKNLSDYKNTIRILYGGRAAESVLAKSTEDISIGASQDIKEATRIISSLVNFSDGIDYSVFGDYGTEIIAEKAKKELNVLWNECYSMVEKNWEMVEKVAEELKAKEKITGEEFLEIVGSTAK